VEVRCQGPGCHIVFEAVRASAKYHNDTCRQRARRNPEQAGKATADQRRVKRRRQRLQAATLRELKAASRQDTEAGLAALELAERIDQGGDTLAALAAAVREHASAMERALKGAAAADPVQARQDEVARRGRLRAVR